MSSIPTTYALRVRPIGYSFYKAKADSLERKKASQNNCFSAVPRSPDPVKSKPSPPLLRLPFDIIEEILSYFYKEDAPTLAILRRTHSTFLSTIPKSHVRAKAGDHDILTRQLRTAERDHPYLFPKTHHPCHRCNAVLPAHHFGDDVEIISFNLDPRRERVCLECGSRICPLCGSVRGRGGCQHHVLIRWKREFPCQRCGHWFLDLAFEKPLRPHCEMHAMRHPALEREAWEKQLKLVVDNMKWRHRMGLLDFPY